MRKKAWLVSGIGNSRSFRRSAESIGIEIMGESAFEDHHRYTHGEIEQIRSTVQVTGSEFVLTTEKDGGKLIPFLTPSDPWWMLRLGTEVVHGEEQLRKLIDVPSSEGNQQLEAHA
jgi:tetraacyldisaccharide 4'-kinase